MSTCDHWCKSVPSVSLIVIKFCLFASIINILARSCHNYKVFPDRAAGMPMTSERHASTLLEFVIQGLPSHWDYFIHLEHALRKLVEITSTNNISSCVHQTNLDCLKIMREIGLSLNCVEGNTLGLNIIHVKFLGVLFHYINLQVWVCNWSNGYRLLDHFSSPYRINCSCRHNHIRFLNSCALSIASLCMFEYFLVSSLNCFTLRACKNQLLEHFFHDTVHLIYRLCALTHSALPF